jgi:CrcB protein
MMKSLLLVCAGGAIGSVLRYLTIIIFRNQPFPYGTLVVNIVGSFIIGVVAALVIKNTVSNEVRLFVATGICGGFTTFSAFSIESLQLLNENRYGAVFLYIAASFTLGIAAAFAGWMLAK